ncbi:hypothetical protein [Pseudonocardia adelaidensis]|uniref:Uncharacterized protein n=1 Tax=Pseudonocardia adelaidensis TaxID=648754 RepID=A0ABP9NIZ4_9PSEU
MTEPHAAPEPDPEPRLPGMPDLDVDLPADEDADDQPGNMPGEDVDPDAGRMEPPD